MTRAVFAGCGIVILALAPAASAHRGPEGGLGSAGQPGSGSLALAPEMISGELHLFPGGVAQASAPGSQPAGPEDAQVAEPVEASPPVHHEPAPGGQSASYGAGLAEISVAYGDHLFQDGDYYRAITEYRRYLFLTRGAGDQAYRAAMAVGEAYLRGRQFEAAAGQFDSVAERAPEGRLRSVALLSAGRAHLLAERPLLAAARLAAARQEAASDPPVASESLFLLGWARLVQKDWDSARSVFAEIERKGGPRAAAARGVLERLETREQVTEKNPLIAGALSIIPGAGHMYLGQWTVGFAALFWNALFIFATGYSIWNAEWGVAAVLGVFELSWFAGTMFGALNGAFRHNRDLMANWMDDLNGLYGHVRELPPVGEAEGLPGELHRFFAAPAGTGSD